MTRRGLIALHVAWPGCRRRALERRKRRQAEEAEDDLDREREAKEQAAAAQARGTDAGATEGTPGPAASSVKAEPESPAPPPPPLAPSVDPSDPIYQAMLAAARAPPGARSSTSLPAPATGALMQHAAVKQELKQVSAGAPLQVTCAAM